MIKTKLEHYFDGILPKDKKKYAQMTAEELEKEINKEKKKSEQLKTW